jgi:hypothetical protein
VAQSIPDEHWTGLEFSSNFTPDNDGSTTVRWYFGLDDDSSSRRCCGASRNHGESAGPGWFGHHEYASGGPGATSPTRPDRATAGATRDRGATSRGGGYSIGNGATARFVAGDSADAPDAIEHTDDAGIADEINRVGARRIATEAQCHYLIRTHPFAYQRGGANRWRRNCYLVLNKFTCHSIQPLAKEQSAAQWGRLPLVDPSTPLSRNAGN